KSALKQQQWKKAEEYLLAAKEILEKSHRESRSLKELYGYLKTLYTEEGNFEKALHFQTEELELEKTLFTINEKVNSLKIETQYEMEKRDMELALQKKKEKLARQRA